MQYLTDDIRITGMQEVIAPESLMQELPITPEVSTLVFSTRQAVSNILHGRDDRLLVVQETEYTAAGHRRTLLHP